MASSTGSAPRSASRPTSSTRAAPSGSRASPRRSSWSSGADRSAPRLHGSARLVLRLRLAVLVLAVLGLPGSFPACGSRSQAGVARRAAQTFRSEGSGGDRAEARLYLSLHLLAGGQARRGDEVPAGTPLQLAARAAARARVRRDLRDPENDLRIHLGRGSLAERRMAGAL